MVEEKDKIHEFIRGADGHLLNWEQRIVGIILSSYTEPSCEPLCCLESEKSSGGDPDSEEFFGGRY